jgi:hypothetical protein
MGGATLEKFLFVGAFHVTSFDIQGENPKSEAKTFFFENFVWRFQIFSA